MTQRAKTAIAGPPVHVPSSAMMLPPIVRPLDICFLIWCISYQIQSKGAIVVMNATNVFQLALASLILFSFELERRCGRLLNFGHRCPV